MDQPGPRPTALKSPIINRSDLQTPRQRTLYAMLTLAFWAFWLYLWVPLLALLAWALGIQQAYQYMVVLGGYHDVVRLLGDYSITILVFDGILLLWAGAAAPPVTAQEMTEHFGTGHEALASWANQRRLYVTHDQNGRIARVSAAPIL
jgi:biofilm PGA synthesis protein PgaD